jgi:hypothetical protein
MNRTFLLTALLACTLSTASARADEPQEVDASSADLIARGVALRDEGRDREALELFQRANLLHASPRARAQIALAEQALGSWTAAESGLVEVLAADDPWIGRNRAALEGALATVRTHLGWIEVEANVAADLWIDGQQVGSLPMPHPLRVSVGHVTLAARAVGFAEENEAIDVAPGDRVHVSLTLVVEHRDRAAAPPPASPPPPEKSRSLAWATLGASVALVAGGAVAHVVREENAAIYDDNQRCLAPGRSRDSLCGSNGSTAQAATWIAVTGYAGGAALGIVSAVLFTRTSSGEPARVGRAPCDLTIGGVTCGLRF